MVVKNTFKSITTEEKIQLYLTFIEQINNNNKECATYENRRYLHTTERKQVG